MYYMSRECIKYGDESDKKNTIFLFLGDWKNGTIFKLLVSGKISLYEKYILGMLVWEESKDLQGKYI